jgi:hypothetical protein
MMERETYPFSRMLKKLVSRSRLASILNIAHRDRTALAMFLRNDFDIFRKSQLRLSYSTKQTR